MPLNLSSKSVIILSMEWTEKENSFDTFLDEDIVTPPMYKVIFYNDDFTTKEFVVDVLISIFHKSYEEAEILMETVHQKGSAIIGVYVYDIAATRVALTIQNARSEGFPLQCKLEEV